MRALRGTTVTRARTTQTEVRQHGPAGDLRRDTKTVKTCRARRPRAIATAGSTARSLRKGGRGSGGRDRGHAAGTGARRERRGRRDVIVCRPAVRSPAFAGGESARGPGILRPAAKGGGARRHHGGPGRACGARDSRDGRASRPSRATGVSRVHLHVRQPARWCMASVRARRLEDGEGELRLSGW